LHYLRVYCFYQLVCSGGDVMLTVFNGSILFSKFQRIYLDTKPGKVS
jgi:hypothetical protein